MKTKFVDYQNNNLKQYFKEIRQYNLLNAEEEIELAKKIKKGDKKAFDIMVNANLRLVVNIAKKYITPEWKLSDLIQEGNIGLLKAVKKYDHKKMVRFSTYASWWIKQAVTRSISNKRRTIRLPHRKEEKLRKINKMIEELSQKLNRKPSIKEVAEKLGFKEFDVLNLKNISENISSIDSEINDDGLIFLNLLDDIKHSPEVILDKIVLEKETNEILEQLKEKERQVLKLRFAFERREKQTLKSIALDLGISPETVRQIEIKATKKIRENFPHLKDYLYI